MPDICIVCGKPKLTRNKYYCSKKCMGLEKQGYKKCPVCGKIFKDALCNMTVCCSPECSRNHRTSLHAQGVYDESIRKMRQGFRKKVDNMAPEEFWTSKYWMICSPSGKIYECQNLLNFIREHAEMFDGTIKQAYDGFQKIKETEQGKRHEHPCISWKGWTLLKWSE